MPIAIPIPRAVFARLGHAWVSHVTRQTSLLGTPAQPGIVTRRVLRNTDEWEACEVNLVGSSGFGNHGRRLLRDYSIIDFELRLAGRGSYTYFFSGDPSTWGLLKNIGVSNEADLLKQGYAIIRVATTDLLGRSAGPIFVRPDDKAVVIRGSYAGPARVKGIPIA
jgi:hypothetical protein